MRIQYMLYRGKADQGDLTSQHNLLGRFDSIDRAKGQVPADWRQIEDSSDGLEVWTANLPDGQTAFVLGEFYYSSESPAY